MESDFQELSYKLQLAVTKKDLEEATKFKDEIKVKYNFKDIKS